jgi:hypothetical protein
MNPGEMSKDGIVAGNSSKAVKNKPGSTVHGSEFTVGKFACNRDNR